MSISEAVIGELTALGAIGPLQGRASAPVLAPAPARVEVPKGPLDEAKMRSLCSKAIERLDAIEAVVQDLKEVFKEINESLEAPEDEDPDGA